MNNNSSAHGENKDVDSAHIALSSIKRKLASRQRIVAASGNPGSMNLPEGGDDHSHSERHSNALDYKLFPRHDITAEQMNKANSESDGRNMPGNSNASYKDPKARLLLPSIFNRGNRWVKDAQYAYDEDTGCFSTYEVKAKWEARMEEHRQHEQQRLEAKKEKEALRLRMEYLSFITAHTKKQYIKNAALLFGPPKQFHGFSTDNKKTRKRKDYNSNNRKEEKFWTAVAVDGVVDSVNDLSNDGNSKAIKNNGGGGRITIDEGEVPSSSKTLVDGSIIISPEAIQNRSLREELSSIVDCREGEGRKADYSDNAAISNTGSEKTDVVQPNLSRPKRPEAPSSSANHHKGGRVRFLKGANGHAYQPNAQQEGSQYGLTANQTNSCSSNNSKNSKNSGGGNHHTHRMLVYKVGENKKTNSSHLILTDNVNSIVMGGESAGSLPTTLTSSQMKIVVQEAAREVLHSSKHANSPPHYRSSKNSGSSDDKNNVTMLVMNTTPGLVHDNTVKATIMDSSNVQMRTFDKDEFNESSKEENTNNLPLTIEDLSTKYVSNYDNALNNDVQTVIPAILEYRKYRLHPHAHHHTSKITTKSFSSEEAAYEALVLQNKAYFNDFDDDYGASLPLHSNVSGIGNKREEVQVQEENYQTALAAVENESRSKPFIHPIVTSSMSTQSISYYEEEFELDDDEEANKKNVLQQAVIIEDIFNHKLQKASDNHINSNDAYHHDTRQLHSPGDLFSGTSERQNITSSSNKQKDQNDTDKLYVQYDSSVDQQQGPSPLGVNELESNAITFVDNNVDTVFGEMQNDYVEDNDDESNKDVLFYIDRELIREEYASRLLNQEEGDSYDVKDNEVSASFFISAASTAAENVILLTNENKADLSKSNDGKNAIDDILLNAISNTENDYLDTYSRDMDFESNVDNVLSSDNNQANEATEALTPCIAQPYKAAYGSSKAGVVCEVDNNEYEEDYYEDSFTDIEDCEV